MISKNTSYIVAILISLFLLSACGGGGESSSSASLDSGSVSSSLGGIAVDPYIVGAVFQEVGSDGTILQRQSSSSNEFGEFTFPEPLTMGSTIELKISNKGLHGGTPFQGMLRRKVDVESDEPLVVSPLTTILANGATEEDLLLALDNAGITGLTAADLFADPMAGLETMTNGVTDQDLVKLQASMAITAYMEITGNLQAGADELYNSEQMQILRSMVTGLQETLNADEYSRIKDSLAADPSASSPMMLGDLILTVLQQQQTLVAMAKEEMAATGNFDPALIQQTVQTNLGQSMAMTKANYQTRVPGSPANLDGLTLYSVNCSMCHGAIDSTTKPGRTAAVIQDAINNNTGGMGSLSNLTAGEIQAIAEVLPAAPSTPTTPPAAPDGSALYGDNCAGCHGTLEATEKPGRTTADIQASIDANLGGMGFLASLTTAEIEAIAGVLPAAPPTDPTTPPDGTALYNSECSGCHGTLDATAKPGRTAADIQTAIDANLGGMGFLANLTADEVLAVADVLPAAPATPTTPPAAPDGAALYADNCAGCHDTLDATTKPGRTTADIQTAIDANLGGMGYLAGLTADEVQAIADVLPGSSVSGPDYGDCTACHGQPPAGNRFPDTAGAHASHVSLPSINNNCAVCHSGAAHDSIVDVTLDSRFDAMSGAAIYNGDGTCSNISCHGGQTTPDWWTGSIVVDTQCSSCHTSGSGQYNSYASGRHTKHLSMGYDCTVCHNTTTLQNGHFSDLATPAFEQSPSATIGGGGSAQVGSYSSGTCSSIACHGSKSW